MLERLYKKARVTNTEIQLKSSIYMANSILYSQTPFFFFIFKQGDLKGYSLLGAYCLKKKEAPKWKNMVFSHI